MCYTSPDSDDEGAVHIANIPFYCYYTHVIDLSNLTATRNIYFKMFVCRFGCDVCMKT